MSSSERSSPHPRAWGGLALSLLLSLSLSGAASAAAPGAVAPGAEAQQRPGGLALSEVQGALRAAKLKAWLLCDFKGSDPGARRLLGLAEGTITTRRWCYVFPAKGAPLKLVHAIEPGVLAHLPGEAVVYRRWAEFEAGVKRLARRGGRGPVAMAYSPRDAIPYADRMPAGLVELVRSAGVKPRSSADLVQRFQATLDDAALESHRRAAAAVREVAQEAMEWAAAQACAGQATDEWRLQQRMAAALRARGLVYDHPPIVAVGPHAADPHYAPAAQGALPIERESLLLIDIWAKEPAGVYADMTLMAYLGREVPEPHQARFQLVLDAQQAALGYIQGELKVGRLPVAFQADRRARGVMRRAGHEAHFLHRTGHSITYEVHGEGAHLDDLETHDMRRLIPRTCFSIEPGLYLKGEAGYRSEIDVCVIPSAGGAQAEVTTPARQGAIQALGCEAAVAP